MEKEERKIHEEYETLKSVHDAHVHDEIIDQMERESTDGEFTLDTMSVTDVIVELCAGYTREGFTIGEKRFNKLMTRLCDAYDDDVRTIEEQRERITGLAVALQIERITGGIRNRHRYGITKKDTFMDHVGF